MSAREQIAALVKSAGVYAQPLTFSHAGTEYSVSIPRGYAHATGLIADIVCDRTELQCGIPNEPGILQVWTRLDWVTTVDLASWVASL